MFSKNEPRPASSSASASNASNAYRREAPEGMAYDASETDDFNSFQSTAGRPEGARPVKKARPAGKAPKKMFGNKMLIIAIAAAVVVLLLAVLIIGLILGRADHITYENNAFIAYADDAGTYHVSANGKQMNMDFEGEVEVVCAADNSFAYAVDNGAEGYHVYLLDGKKITAMTTTPVDAVVAFATLKPGFVAQEPNDFRLYTEDGDERVVQRKVSPENFLISADASTVAYTAIKDNGTDVTRRMYFYQDGITTSGGNSLPVGISNYGDYIYATKSKDSVTDLYVITTKDAEPYPIEKSTGFVKIVATNVKGNEVLFTTSDGENSASHIYSFKKKGTGTTYSLGARLMNPVSADPDIAIHESFAKTYMIGTNDEGQDMGIYYIYKDYTWKRITPTSQGDFTQDGDYYYYIHENDGDYYLKRCALKGEKFKTETIYNGALELCVTKKNNVYFLDPNDSSMRFYDASKDSKPDKRGLGEDISDITFYTYGNTIYYTKEDTEGNAQVYVSKEGSEMELCEMDSVQLTNIPTFTHPNSKKCYAYYYDETEGSWLLFYTSNGSRFKLITNDCRFDTVDVPNSSLPNGSTPGGTTDGTTNGTTNNGQGIG